MRGTMPKISVCMPTFNNECYLADAINSIIGQSFKDWELIVINDGSEDSTDKLMDYFVKKDKRIKYFKNDKNRGIAYTRNKAIQHSVGEYIAVMDSDDIMHPDRLKESIKKIEKVNFVYSPYLQTDEHAKIFGAMDCPKILTIPNIIEGFTAPHVTILAKRECFEKFPYKEEMKVNDDLYLVLRWVQAGLKYKKINKALMIVRYHNKSVSQTRDKEVKMWTERMKEEFLCIK